MWSWISKLDPNMVLGVITTIGGILYHWLNPSTQARIQANVAAAWSTALDVADKVMAGLAMAAAVEGKTREQLQAQLWAEAKIQLGHIGLNPDNLPPAVTAAVNALVSKYLAAYKPAA